jgi:hypothetical protein
VKLRWTAKECTYLHMWTIIGLQDFKLYYGLHESDLLKTEEGIFCPQKDRSSVHRMDISPCSIVKLLKAERLQLEKPSSVWCTLFWRPRLSGRMGFLVFRQPILQNTRNMSRSGLHSLSLPQGLLLGIPVMPTRCSRVGLHPVFCSLTINIPAPTWEKRLLQSKCRP